jgi:hypothetical protein
MMNGKQLDSLKRHIRDLKGEHYAEESKKRLKTIVGKKFETTFIGALAIFEKHFGYLWGKDKERKTQSEEDFADLWEDARNELLNHGNNQMRAAQEEIANQTVIWNRYQYNIPVKGDEE